MRGSQGGEGEIVAEGRDSRGKGRCPCRNDEKDNRASQKGNVACCRPL